MTRSKVALALLALVLLSSCSLEQTYRVDERLAIVTPRPLAKVRLPVELRWRVRDLEVATPVWSSEDQASASRGDRYFAVFVDRPPIAPGRTLLSIANGDVGCRAQPGCPDIEYFAERGVHVTADTELTLSRLVDRRNRGDANDWHEATIVFMADDRTGEGEVGDARRLGTAAFTVRFIAERDS